MKSIFISIFFIFSFSLFANIENDVIVGTYINPEKTAHIEIYKTGDKFEGKLVWLKDNRKDNRNPKKELQERELQGLTIIENLTKDSDTKYSNGIVYDPDSGNTYKCKMWFEENNMKTLHIRGYIGISLLGRSKTLERI